MPEAVARHRLLDIHQLCRDWLQRAVAVETVDQRPQSRKVGILLVGVQRDAVILRKRGEFGSNTGQARGIRIGIAIELQLEIARAGIFPDIGDAAGAFDPVVEADGMPDRDPLQPPTTGQKGQNILVAQITRQPRIDAGDIPGHAVEEIHPHATQQRVQDRLVDFGRPIEGCERRDIAARAGLDLR